jgi:hypothetical protein
MSATVADPKPVETPGNPPPFEGDDAPRQPASKPTDKAKDKPDDAGDLRKENQSLREQLREREDSEKYWAELARGRGAGAPDSEDTPADAPPPDDEPEESADEFLDRLSKEGPRAVAKVAEKIAAKAGYVRKADVEKIAAKIASEIVERKAGRMSADAKLVGQYPQLQDPKSELFQATATIYREMTDQDPELKKSPATLFAAARIAKAELKAAGNGARGRDVDDEPGDYREDREDRESRRRRIDAQQGDIGRGRSTPYEGDDDPMGPAQRDVLDLFARAGVDEKSYREERTKLRRRR